MPKVTLPIDSRELLGVKEEDTAVVEGVARRDERQLLGDQEQRVGIARAIVASPAIIGGGPTYRATSMQKRQTRS